MSHHYFITDVFAEGPYAGNQLATFPEAADISSGEMQKIARAFNFPETTFITGGSLESGFDVRIFTPGSELPFAGHPTLGTSYLIRDHLLKSDTDSITLNLGVGPIPVQFGDDGVLWMTQNSPTFGATLDAEEVANNLELSIEDIAPDFPCQFVSTGLEFLLVPVNSYEVLTSVQPRPTEYPVFVFCAGGYSEEQSIQARMFASALGVSEDPATGSANGCLASYLVEYEFLGSSSVDIAVGQGYEINRPSQLYLRSSKSADGYSIDVGGKVNLVAEGQWLV